MKTLTLAASILSVAMMAGANAPPAKPTEGEISKLIQQLGDTDNKVRENAFKQLSSIGEPAVELLKAASKNPNRGISRRAELVLDNITVRAGKNRQHALDTFVEEGTPPTHIELPGWRRLAKVAGDDQASRALYLEIYNADRPLLDAYQNDSKEAAKLYVARLEDPVYSQIVDGRLVKERTLPEVALLFLVAGDKRVQIGKDHLVGLMWQAIDLAGPKIQFIPKNFTSDPKLRKLIGRWVARPVDAIEVVGAQVWAALILDLKEGTIPAKEYLQRDDATNEGKIAAMSALTLLGNREDMEFVAPYLKDSTSWGALKAESHTNFGQDFKVETSEIQARDAALAALVQLSGQELDAYHMSSKEVAGMTGFFFEDPAHREAALEKWARWVKENPIEKSEQPSK